MKILYHHRTLGDGAEGIHIREMVQAFRALGHDVRVIGPSGEQAPTQFGKASRLARLKRAIPGRVFELMEIGYSLMSFLQTSLEIVRWRPTFVYDRYITFNAGVVLAGKLWRVPVLLEVNAPLALERQASVDERLQFRELASRMERWICAQAARTIVVSSPLRDYLVELGVPDSKCVVMPNGANPQSFTVRAPDDVLRARIGLPRATLVVGFTGVLRPWHGLDLLLQAAAILHRTGKPVALLIVGGGPHRETFEASVKRQGLEDYVKVTGHLEHCDVPAYVALFDVAVSPAATFYASPMKVLEYMAMGKAVVVPGTPNFTDFIEPGVTGLTFRDGAAESLAGVIEWLQREPQMAARLGDAARRSIETRLNWHANAAASCALLTEIRSPA